MFKCLTLLSLIVFVFIQTLPAYCRTAAFQLSVTIPEHVMLNNSLVAAPFSVNPYQLVQTQTVIRNNQNVSLTSIVVP